MPASSKPCPCGSKKLYKKCKCKKQDRARTEKFIQQNIQSYEPANGEDFFGYEDYDEYQQEDAE